MNRKPPGLFVAGTDTGVGKTHVAAMIVRALRAAGHRVGVYKPAASGCTRDPQSGELVCHDAVALWQAADKPGRLERVAPQRFAASLTPHRAAQAEGRKLDSALLRDGLAPWLADSEVVVVEGAGGLFSPLGEDELNIDVAAEFGFPIVIVAANRLGTLHATLATVNAASRYCPGLPIAGVVLNEITADVDDESRTTNAAELHARLDVPLLAEVRFNDQQFVKHVDWMHLARGHGVQ